MCFLDEWTWNMTTIHARHHRTSVKKREYNNIVATWKIVFQALDLKE